MNQVEAVVVRPSLLIWARETAGFSLEAAAQKLGISASKLLSYELGEGSPSFPQLRKMATTYRRSLGLFFLPQPPETPEQITDFRGINGKSEDSYSSELRYQIRHARYRRKIALELMSELGDQIPKFNISASLDEDPQIVGGRVRKWLGVSLKEQESWTGEYDSLNSWLSVFESKHILTFQTKEINQSEMLGACIFFSDLPIILLMVSTVLIQKFLPLCMKLAHLALGLSGVSSEEISDEGDSEARYRTDRKVL